MNKKDAFEKLEELLNGQTPEQITKLLCDYYSTYQLEQFIEFLENELR